MWSPTWLIPPAHHSIVTRRATRFDRSPASCCNPGTLGRLPDPPFLCTCFPMTSRCLPASKPVCRAYQDSLTTIEGNRVARARAAVKLILARHVLLEVGRATYCADWSTPPASRDRAKVTTAASASSRTSGRTTCLRPRLEVGGLPPWLGCRRECGHSLRKCCFVSCRCRMRALSRPRFFRAVKHGLAGLARIVPR